MTRVKKVQLGASNVSMPIFGLGTYLNTGSDSVFDTLDSALEIGYRLIDTAQLYANEAEIGQALKILLPKYKLQRSDIFVTSKLHIENMYKDKARKSLEKSLQDLQLDYLDLFLIHYPKPIRNQNQDPKNRQVRLEIWAEMEKFLDEGLTRSIGVSNYEICHLKELVEEKKIKHKPVLNQCEFNPYFCNWDLVDYCRTNNIHFQGFCPLARRNAPILLQEPLLLKIAQKHGATVGQVVLAWQMKHGISVLPKSSKPERLRENFGANNLALDEEDSDLIFGLNKKTSCTKTCHPWEVL